MAGNGKYTSVRQVEDGSWIDPDKCAGNIPNEGEITRLFGFTHETRAAAEETNARMAAPQVFIPSWLTMPPSTIGPRS